MNMYNIIAQASRDVGLIFSDDCKDSRPIISLDDQTSDLRRIFVPELRKRGVDIYAFGSVGFALKPLKEDEKQCYLLLDTQNIKNLRLSKARVTTREAARAFLNSIKLYLESLPATVEELRSKEDDRTHWIGKQLSWQEFPHIRQFAGLLRQYQLQQR